MIGTGLDILRGGRRMLTAALALAAMAAVLAVAAAPASAQSVIHDPVWYDIPNLYGTDADASIESFDSPGKTWGYIYIDNRAGRYNKMYVQAKPVARFAADGEWKRQTVDSYKGQNWTNAWDDSTQSPYNGYKFRLCRSVLGPDKCGKASRTIYQ